MEAINRKAKKTAPECQDKDIREEKADDANLSMTDITVEEVSIDGICGVY